MRVTLNMHVKCDTRVTPNMHVKCDMRVKFDMIVKPLDPPRAPRR